MVGPIQRVLRAQSSNNLSLRLLISMASKLQAFDLLTPSEGWLLLDQRALWTSDDAQTWREITPGNLGRYAI